MKHLMICREYPPAPAGGIGTYLDHITRLLAEHGETVHVIGQSWAGAEQPVEERQGGRLIIHRIPFQDWNTRDYKPSLDEPPEGRGLFESVYPAQSYAWKAGLLAERLIEEEGIDVVEAQEYEAPLYFFQLRRTLGLGPTRQPPLIVHLHSPSQFIFHFNDYDEAHLAHTTATRLEAYSIRTADALLCPSHYLACQVETHFKLECGSIHVIPYPLGHPPLLERDPRTWEQGTICYLGRLERRKGILEWIDAAVSVAPEFPAVTFEFIGANVLGTSHRSGEEVVRGRIPEDLKARFHFRGHQPRALLPNRLAGARMAVVPSRWDNFPNTCMEAMGTGLPVLASCEGGMREMIEDGRTGWIASPAGSEGLAAALRRALGTPASTLADMGREAAASIRRICDNSTIVQRQLEFRASLVRQGCARSVRIPDDPAWTGPAVQGRAPQSNVVSSNGIGLAVISFNNGRHLDDCLASVQNQTTKFSKVVIIDAGSTDDQTTAALDEAQRNGWEVLRLAGGKSLFALTAGLDWMYQQQPPPLALAFLDAQDRLRPEFVSLCEQVFVRDQRIGLVSSWALDLGRGNTLWSRPCPSFPHQWLANDLVPFAAVRREALIQARRINCGIGYDRQRSNLFDSVMASGWLAVTVPQVLGEAHFEVPARPYMPDPYRPVRDCA